MKRIFLLTTIVIYTVQFSMGQFFNQYFDGADTSVSKSIIIDIDTASQNVWQIGVPQKVIFNSSATQPAAIVTDTQNFYPTSDTSRFIAKIVMNFPNWGIFALQWKQKLDFDQGLDGGIVEYTTDKGNTWKNVFNNPYTYNYYGFLPTSKDTLVGGEFAFSGTDAVWRDIWLCFDYSWIQQFALEDTLQIRFTMLSDGVNTNKEGWMIDNLLAHTTIIHTGKEAVQESYLKVFPNPSNKVVNIQAQKIMDFHIIEEMELIDQLGCVVDKWINIPTRFWFETTKYDDGLYYLKIKTNLRSETIPLVIQKN